MSSLARGFSRRDWLGGCAALLSAYAAGSGQGKTQVPDGALRVGIAETSITPGWVTELWGYGARLRYSTGVHDPIFAKAFLFDWGKRFLVIMTDVGGIDFALRRRIGKKIAAALKMPDDAIMIQCSHDHSAPALLGTPIWPADERFQLFYEDQLFAVAVQAYKDLAPATLSFGQVESTIGLNRRVGNRENTWNKDSGPIDSVFNVLQVKAPDGHNRGIIVNYPSHPVCLRPDNVEISADFPGVLYKDLGASEKCPVAYLQGCCGDTIPKVFGTTKEMEEYGHKMADEARRALAKAEPVGGSSLDFSAARVNVTFVSPYTLDELRSKYAELTKSPSAEREQWAERLLRYLEDGGDPHQSRDTYVQALRLGDIAMAVLPGEILHLTAKLIRQEFPRQRKLMVAAYANDTSPGYLPHADEFPKGKYEVEEAWKIYGTLRTTPDMERNVREAAVALLHGLLA